MPTVGEFSNCRDEYRFCLQHCSCTRRHPQTLCCAAQKVAAQRLLTAPHMKLAKLHHDLSLLPTWLPLLLPRQGLQRSDAVPSPPQCSPATGTSAPPVAERNAKGMVGAASSTDACNCKCKCGVGQKPTSPLSHSCCPSSTRSPTATVAEPPRMCTYSAKRPSSSPSMIELQLYSAVTWIPPPSRPC